MIRSAAAVAASLAARSARPAMEPRSHRPDGARQRVGRVLVGQLLQVAQHDDLAVAKRQRQSTARRSDSTCSARMSPASVSASAPPRRPPALRRAQEVRGRRSRARRWRRWFFAMPHSHGVTAPRPGSNRPASCITVMNASCTTSSATASSAVMWRAKRYTSGRFLRYSAPKASASPAAVRRTSSSSGTRSVVGVLLTFSWFDALWTYSVLDGQKFQKRPSALGSRLWAESAGRSGWERAHSRRRRLPARGRTDAVRSWSCRAPRAESRSLEPQAVSREPRADYSASRRAISAESRASFASS